MVALPEPRPETPRERQRREAMEDIQRSLLGRQLMGSELTPAGLAARQREGLETLKGLAVGIPSTILGLPADIIGLPAVIGDLLARLTGQDPNAVYKELAEMSPEERDANLLTLAESPQEYAALSEFFNTLEVSVPVPAPRPTEEEREDDDDDFIPPLPMLPGMSNQIFSPPMRRITRDIQEVAGARGIAKLFGFGDNFQDPGFDAGFTTAEILTPIPLLDFGIPALMKRGSRSTDLEPLAAPDAPVEPDIIGSASDIGPPRTIDTPLGPTTVFDTVPLPREEPTFDIVELPEGQPTRLQATGDITDQAPREIDAADVQFDVDFLPPGRDPESAEFMSFGQEMVHIPTGITVPENATVRATIEELANFIPENRIDNIPDVGEVYDFSRPDADPALGETELFQFEEDMFHTETGTRIPAGFTVRGSLDDFVTAGTQQRPARFANRTEVTQRMATTEETEAVARGEDPAAVAPGAQAPTTLDDIPVVTLPETRPGRGDEVELRDFNANEEFNIQDVFEIEENSVHVPTGIFVPEGTFVRGNLLDFEVSRGLPTTDQEGIATLPAAEDIIDVEPVAQAALTPVRTEGQQQLRQQAFPITEDEAIFTPTTDVSSLSGRTGIATIDDPDPEILQITGPPADYSPTYQTIDRLEERAYTKEELIEILKAQPESAMRDLKGSGYLEYLESPYAPAVFDGPADIRLDYAESTPQLKVRTVTNSEVEDYVNMADPSNAIKPPFTNNRGDIPNVDKQVLLMDSQARDRGVIILSNSNTKNFGGRDLSAVHDYFGTSRDGVPGYIAHARFEYPVRNDGKVVASINEIQGNTVSTTSRKGSGYQKMTPLMAARHSEAIKNDGIADLVEADVILQQYEKNIKQYNDLQKNSFLRNSLLDEKPTQESYERLLENFQRGMNEGKGVFSELSGEPFKGSKVNEDDFYDLVARTATSEDKAYFDDLFERAGIMGYFDGFDNPERIATFDDLFMTDDVFQNDTLIRYRVRSEAQRLENDGELSDELKKELWFLLESYYSGPTVDDFGRRALFGDPGSNYKPKKYLARMKRKKTTRDIKFKKEIDAKFGEGEYEKIKEAFSIISPKVNMKKSLMDDNFQPATVGQPFAVTRDFDEYMPRLIIQEMVKRGEVDELIFPNFEDLMMTGGRSSFSRDPAKLAGFKNTYDKGVKKGLNKIKAEHPEFNFEIVDNYELTPGKVLDHPVIKINLRDPAVRAIFEGRLIRRAKGGAVDLRPRKMIHSGIGAMAREVM